MVLGGVVDTATALFSAIAEGVPGVEEANDDVIAIAAAEGPKRPYPAGDAK